MNNLFIENTENKEKYILVAEIRKSGQLLSEEYEEDGIHIKAYVPRALAAKKGLIY